MGFCIIKIKEIKMYKRMQWIFGAAALTVALTACPEITEQDRQDNLIARDQTGTVITADGTEAEFDFKSGKGCNRSFFAKSYCRMADFIAT